MIKRLYNISVVALIALFALSCSTKNYEPEPIWENAVIVAYANLGELHTKSHIAAFDLTSRIAELDDQDKATAELLLSILKDPTTSGIAIDKPAYIAINDCDSEFTPTDMLIALEVCDASLLDATLKSLDNDFDSNCVTLKGDKRIITLDNNLAFGYDNERLVLLQQGAADLTESIAQQLDYAPADVSRFAEQDAAIYLDIDRLFAVALNNLPQDNEDDMEAIEEMQSLYSDYFNTEASATMGLRFDNGAITISSNCEGLSESVTAQLKSANGDHLNLLEASPIALLYMGVSGETIAETLNTAISAMLSDDDAIGANNEINIYKNIALGVVASIEGDLMLALTDANGKLVEDIFGDKNLVFTTANALFTADVKDNYIMDNVKTYGAGLLSKGRDNSYSINAFGNKINIGQCDDTFFVGVNNNATKKSPSAANEAWAESVPGCYSYAMIDFNRLFSSNFGKALLTTIYNNVPQGDLSNTTKLVIENLDRFYILTNGTEQSISSELKLTLKNRETNALEQIVHVAHSAVK